MSQSMNSYPIRLLPVRQGAILRIIVSDYVTNAMPVGSEHIAKDHSLGVSPATIRNDMAALEEEGYIVHPYTSAGRIPSDKGYRYYIQVLMEEDPPQPATRKQIQEQFSDWEGELSQLTDLSAALLAQLVSMVALVTSPRAPTVRIKRLELVGLQEFVVLMVLVLQEARVLQALFHADEAYSQDELYASSQHLNELVAGTSAPEMTQRLGGAILNPFEEHVAQNMNRMVQEEEAQRLELAQSGGLRHLLSQPEFASPERVVDLVGLLEDRRTLGALLSAVSTEQEVRAIVGDENPKLEMQDLSLVVAPYGIPGGLEGTLAILGPKRMPYNKTIAAVRYFAQLMSGSLAERYT